MKVSMMKYEKKVLVFLQAGIGDAIMRIPALKSLKDNNFYVSILIANKDIGELFLKENLIDDYLLTDFGGKSYSVFNKLGKLDRLYQLIKKINSKDFNTIYFFEGRALPITIFSIFLKSKDKYMMSKYWVSNLFSKCLEVDYHQLHKTESSNQLLELSGLKSKNQDIFLNSFNSKKQPNYIAILSGSSHQEKAKRWDYSSYNQLIKMIIKKNPNKKFLFFGMGNEKDVLNYIDRDLLPHIEEYFGKLTLIETIEKLSTCNIAIGGDSGLMHISNALKVNCVVVFGPTLEHWIKPIGNKVKIFKSTRDCAPCYPQKQFGCENNECMIDTKPDDVAEYLLKSDLI